MTADVDIIINTGDRAQAFGLCQGYLHRQVTQATYRVIVTDDGTAVSHPYIPCTYLRREPGPNDPPHTQTLNLQLAMQHVTAANVIIWEDDDWYGTGYLEEQMQRLQNADLVGDITAYYYGVGRWKGWRIFDEQDGHDWASLMRTAIGPNAMDIWRRSIEGDHSHDRRLWTTAREAGLTLDSRPVRLGHQRAIGIKGMPGRAGCTHADWNYAPDPGYTILKDWVREDWETYAAVLETH